MRQNYFAVRKQWDTIIFQQAVASDETPMDYNPMDADWIMNGDKDGNSDWFEACKAMVS